MMFSGNWGEIKEFCKYVSKVNEWYFKLNFWNFKIFDYVFFIGV